MIFLGQNIYLFLGEYKNIQMLEQKYFHLKKKGQKDVSKYTNLPETAECKLATILSSVQVLSHRYILF